MATVTQLAKQGAHVVLACRRPAEGQRVREAIMAQKVPGEIEVAALDLASLESVRAFAKSFLAKHDSLQGLVNNAGVMNTPAGKTQDGFDTQFGTNHLGHYLLTDLLLPALRKGAPSRIVMVSSVYHHVAQGRIGRIHFDDLNFERRKFDTLEAYAQSKLANVLHARFLAKQLAGTGIATGSIHPGWVRTNLIGTLMPVWIQDYVLRPFLHLAGMIEPWEGTQTTLFVLLSPEVDAHSGAYFSQIGLYGDKTLNKGGWPMASPNPEAHDDQVAARLDAVSRELVGLESREARGAG